MLSVGLLTSSVYVSIQWLLVRDMFDRSDTLVMYISLAVEWVIMEATFLWPIVPLTSFLLVAHTLNTLHALLEKYSDRLKGSAK